MWHTLGKMRHPDVRSEAIGLAVLFLSFLHLLRLWLSLSSVIHFFRRYFHLGIVNLVDPQAFSPVRFTNLDALRGQCLTRESDATATKILGPISVVISPYRQRSSSTVNAEMNH